MRALAVFALLILLPGAARSQDVSSPCPTDPEYETLLEPSTFAPTTIPYGTVGMSNVVSAEPLGKGGLSLQLRGNFYQQTQAGPGTPLKGADITTFSLGAAYGVNPYVDAFIGTDAYKLQQATGSSTGPGTTFLGVQGTLPLPEDAGFRMGLQLAALLGTSGNPITTTLAPSGDLGTTGYAYLETRTGTDLMARMIQSLMYTVGGMSLKVHVNEGVISSFQRDKRVLLVTGAGAQLTLVPAVVLGLELNDRTFIQAVSATDPLWITPSVVIRIPSHFNLTGGMDVSLSKDHADGSRSLEPWRGFVSASFSMGMKTGVRHRIPRKEIVQAPPPVIQDAAPAEPQPAPVEPEPPVEKKPVRSESEKQLLDNGLLVLKDVYFQTAKTILTPDSKSSLSEVAIMLLKYPKLRLEVAGHTDNRAGFAYNMRLSEGRAEAARVYMVSVAPSLLGRLSAKGYGLTQPQMPNTTEAGRKYNRRVVLRILNLDALKEYNLVEQP